ncbi:MAG TPA: hypothetical protein VJ859_03680 [Allosphingosinicella sp.]|nr:hypothetical protein [Allosphingosinicella sp.]
MLVRMMMVALVPLAAAAVAAAPQPAASPRITFTYADLADLALPASVAAQVRIKQATALKGDQAAGVPPGTTRYYIEAEVVSLIRSGTPLPALVNYLADLPNAADGTPKFRSKSEYLVLAAPVAGRPGTLRLVNRDAHIPWSPEVGERIRTLLKEAAAPGAPPRVTGVGKAFYSPGSLPGESETQLFLLTSDGQPISVSVLRRPGQAPRWAVALGEIVDEAAAPPAPDSLLWYRLACTLPPSLPSQSYADADETSAAAIRADYAVMMQGLGNCVRNRRQ